MKRILPSASRFGLAIGVVASGLFLGGIASATPAKADPDICGSVDTYPRVTVCADSGWDNGWDRGWHGNNGWRGKGHWKHWD
ncbi:Uncharacterised protein [Mycobacteroides abscessus subsp. abscessus]|uniref:Secreted protein n=5 Tax=Mycobacteroides abscessus TaxID=36809 RepID=A0A1N0USI5_9MYCO|nr:hypothetical protein MASS_1025 [Mycobacteroides abscessus subsp. bolletii 50594]EIU16746.1 hypothetical protein MA5S0421_0262 [Mycobacteroides abscessus 5S-0421]EIU18866.1 hypothetical protein MA5S0422_0864 [Mycobacteroides abscessus 5S-0422]EIU26286.1 hypothetical protein MA5S0708_2075 [Mycobacteroides abscessus 5S-0708]EIU35386.1 hypothetical protein MA5S1212_0445 [Mycobacteroides abscessus 5S-1212]EIU44245.1 hypothetical protein MA5S1215_2063 [Mycobacteroides abscessus 5S-1215]EIU64946.